MIGTIRTMSCVAGVAVTLLFGTVGATPASADSTPECYVVVLKDGSRIPAKGKPVSAFGKVRFVDENGRSWVLSASQVDLGATHKANALVAPAARKGTLSITGASPPPREKPEEGEIERGGAIVDNKPIVENKPKPELSVKVYSATWCPHCTSLKKFLADEGISAQVIEVDRLPDAEQARAELEMRQLTGKVSYPTVVIGDKAKAGFSPSWIRATLGR